MANIKTFANRFGIVGDLLTFFWARKLWWMMPMVILLMVFGLLIAFAQTSAIAPFIYTLF